MASITSACFWLCSAHSASATPIEIRSASNHSPPCEQSRSLSSSLLWTQLALRPHIPPIAFGPILSSVRNAEITRASSIAVAVLDGWFALSSTTFSSAAVRATSTTTGTSFSPCPFQRASRLKPSTTSKVPSCFAATRSGISAS